MDWFWQLFDIFQKSAVFAAIQKFTSGDWIMLFAVLWGMAMGLKKGASEMFAKDFGLFLAGLIVLTFYRDVAGSFVKAVPALPDAVAQPIAYILLTGFSWIFIGGFMNLIGKFFHIETSGSLRTFGGTLLGAVYFLLLVSLIAQFLLFIPSGGLQRHFTKENSVSGAMVAGLFPRIQEIVVAPFLKSHTQAAGSGKIPKT